MYDVRAGGAQRACERGEPAEVQLVRDRPRSEHSSVAGGDRLDQRLRDRRRTREKGLESPA